VPALEPYLIEPIFEQFRALLPERKTNHPLGPATAGYSSFFGASGSSTAAAQMLFVLAALLTVLLQGGTLTWHRREPHRPHSALRLAVERPG
jgi:hypothetical protein